MGVLRLQESDIPYRGRLALILLDTVFETACFVYLRKELGWKLAQLEELADQRSRKKLFEVVRGTKNIDQEAWDRIAECHHERNERAHFDPNRDIGGIYLTQLVARCVVRRLDLPHDIGVG